MSAPPLRRPGFDDIHNGWGSDDFDEISERIALSAEWCEANGGRPALTPAEHKIVKAIIERQVRLGIAAGDFEDCGIPRGMAETIDLGGEK